MAPSSLSPSPPPRRHRDHSPRSRSPHNRHSDHPRTHHRSRSPHRRHDSTSPTHPHHHKSPTPTNSSRRRSRSRSPAPPRKDRPKKTGGGLKWKDKPTPNDDNSREERGLERGYRAHKPPPPIPPPQDNPPPPNSIRAKFGDLPPSASTTTNTTPTTLPSASPPTSQPKPKKPKQTPRPPLQTEPLIIIHINDRLGTKTAVPCLASDSIRLFKAQVAARIGREPHEIMLKRQGERPFKDALTLRDYGVSSGVQLDLEVDTGD